MRIRLKFTKEGKVKYVGHLDTMRLFQRAIKVANIPVAYSKGFSPHSLVYFALPLGVGVSSQGEYMELITDGEVQPKDIKDDLNKVLVDGIKVLDAWAVEEKGDSLMSLVSAADYKINIYPEKNTTMDEINNTKDITTIDELVVLKKSKKGMKEVDIKPLILDYSLEVYENFMQVTCKVLAGSDQNLSPDLLIQAILENQNLEYRLDITRGEMYTYLGNEHMPIMNCGRLQC